jgi:hypothetical protein
MCWQTIRKLPERKKIQTEIFQMGNVFNDYFFLFSDLPTFQELGRQIQGRGHPH